MSSASQIQSEPSASKRKRTEGSDSVQDSTKTRTPERVYLVLHETEDPYISLSHEIIGAYRSLSDANAAAYEFWENDYGQYDEAFEEIEQGDQVPDEETFLYKDVKKDGAMHNVCIDDEGRRSEVMVKSLVLQ